ncbi:fibroblast growth factor 16-like [Ptychodera flava]|uniref:fibroblast growth factor 16-like n=1 Tax=Ptychodera flava TaxID=63121 RepID=UPI00396A840C
MKKSTLTVIGAWLLIIPNLSRRTYATLDRGDGEEIENRISHTDVDRGKHIGPAVRGNLYRQLYCHTGYHLQIFPNGTLGGTPEDHNKYAIVHLIKVHPPFIVAIRGIESGLYLAMNEHGKLYTSRVLNKKCWFLENIYYNLFSVYASARYPVQRDGWSDQSKERFWFISVNRDGEPSFMELSEPNKKRVQFLPRLVDPDKVF